MGFGGLGREARDFEAEYQVVRWGIPPRRIDPLTSLSGITCDQARGHRALAIAGVWRCGVSDLPRNQQATGRSQDLADAERLERLLGTGSP